MGVRVPFLVGLAVALLPVTRRRRAQRPAPDVFPAAFAAQLQRDFPTQRVTALVVDTRTGCTYGLHDGMRITTASVVKAGVLGAVLLRAQDQRRGLRRGSAPAPDR